MILTLLLGSLATGRSIGAVELHMDGTTHEHESTEKQSLASESASSTTACRMSFCTRCAVHITIRNRSAGECGRCSAFAGSPCFVCLWRCGERVCSCQPWTRNPNLCCRRQPGDSDSRRKCLCQRLGECNGNTPASSYVTTASAASYADHRRGSWSLNRDRQNAP
jgi:hypothetical protein